MRPVRPVCGPPWAIMTPCPLGPERIQTSGRSGRQTRAGTDAIVAPDRQGFQVAVTGFAEAWQTL